MSKRPKKKTKTFLEVLRSTGTGFIKTRSSTFKSKKTYQRKPKHLDGDD